MMKRMVLVCGLLAAAVLYADDDVDLRLNGDFRGAAVNSSSAPGWSAPTKGSARVVATHDPEDFALELKGTASEAAESLTDFHPVYGNMLEFDADIRGSGNAVITVYFFDSTKKLIAKSGTEQKLTAFKMKFKKNFMLAEKSAFVRIGIAAAPNSSATFEDIDAEFKNVSGVTAVFAKSPTAVKQDTPVQSGKTISLADNQEIKWEDIRNGTVYSVSVPVGKDVDIDLGEKNTAAEQWKIVTADPKFVRAKIEHDTDSTLGNKAE